MPVTPTSPPSGTFWVMELSWPPAPPVQTAGEVAFRRAMHHDAEAVAFTAELDAAEVFQRLDSGRRCYAGWVRDMLAVCGWASFEHEDIGEQGLRLRLNPGEAYIWNCVTGPVYRRRGLYAALLQYIAGELRAEGLQRLWIGADADNTPSHKGMARAGFQPVLDLYARDDAGRRGHRLVSRPGVSATLLDAARRVLLGDGADLATG